MNNLYYDLGQYSQPKALEELFSKDGDEEKFFIEAGAFDGIGLSQTLRLELLGQNWTGLLVEPHQEPYQMLRSKGRNAWTLPTCLSRTIHVETVEFQNPIGTACCGAIDDDLSAYKDVPMGDSFEIQCFPLYSVLRAIDRTKVDLLALDIEGSDLQVLQTIPFDKIDITVIILESRFIDADELRRFLNKYGYVFYKRVNIDDIFIKAKNI